jgi:general stress protein YciG
MIIPDPTAPIAAPAAPSKAHRGFAAMSAEQRSDIARRGGKAAHAAGTGHEWSRETAKAAGSKGGKASSVDSAAMAERGRKGGAARNATIAARKAAKL